jgi:hypothetical protein
MWPAIANFANDPRREEPMIMHRAALSDDFALMSDDLEVAPRRGLFVQSLRETGTRLVRLADRLEGSKSAA